VTSGPGPRGEREGHVVALVSAASEGQWVVAEDREGARWEVECLGEPVEVGARIAFEPVGRGATGRGVLVRVDPSSREAWVCTLRRARGRLELTPFAGLEAPPLRLLEADAQAAPDGSRVVVVPKREGRADRSRRKAARSPRRATERALPVRVVEVLGAAGDPDADHRALCFKHRLPAPSPVAPASRPRRSIRTRPARSGASVSISARCPS